MKRRQTSPASNTRKEQKTIPPKSEPAPEPIYTQENLDLLLRLKNEISELESTFYKNLPLAVPRATSTNPPNWSNLKNDFIRYLEGAITLLQQINFEIKNLDTSGIIAANPQFQDMNKDYFDLKKMLYHYRALLLMLERKYNDAHHCFSKALHYDRKYREKFCCMDDANYLTPQDRNLFLHYLLNLYSKQDYAEILESDKKYSYCEKPSLDSENFYPSNVTVNPLYVIFTRIDDRTCVNEGLYLMTHSAVESEFHLVIGKALIELGKADEAKEYLANAYFLRAKNCVSVGQYGMAILNYRLASTYDSENHALTTKKRLAQYNDNGDTRIFSEAGNILNLIPRDDTQAREAFLVDLLELSNLSGKPGKQPYFVELAQTTHDPFILFHAYLGLSRIEILKKEEASQDLLKSDLENIVRNFLSLPSHNQEIWFFEIENITILLVSEQLSKNITTSHLENFRQILNVYDQLITAYERIVSQRYYLKTVILLLQHYSGLLTIYTENNPDTKQFQGSFVRRIEIFFNFMQRTNFLEYNFTSLEIAQLKSSFQRVLDLENKHNIEHQNQEKAEHFINHESFNANSIKKSSTGQPTFFQIKTLDFLRSSNSKTTPNENNAMSKTTTPDSLSIGLLSDPNKFEDITNTFIDLFRSALFTFHLGEYSDDYQANQKKSNFRIPQFFVLTISLPFIHISTGIDYLLKEIKENDFLDKNFEEIRKVLLSIDHFLNALIEYSKNEKPYTCSSYLTSGLLYFKRYHMIELLKFIVGSLTDEPKNLDLFNFCKDYYFQLSQISQQDIHLFIYLTRLVLDHSNSDGLGQRISIVEQQQQILSIFELQKKMNEIQNTLDRNNEVKLGCFGKTK